MDTEGFGPRLRACRLTAGLSQQELAEQSGLSIRAISDLERGRTRWPRQDSVHRLADVLGLRDAARAQFIAAAGRRLAGDTAAAATGNGGPERAVPRYLPAAPPSFVGRAEYLAALSQVLDEPGGTAVITAIGGTAGVGKTALAVQWAHQAATNFPDGQLFVNLRGFDPSGSPVTPAQAVRVLLEALQIPADRMPQTVEGQLGLYRSLLAGKRILVVLDNARDVAQVRPLLPGSATCRVVVTSRNQLTSLTAIEAAQPLTLGVLSDAEGYQLLRVRLGAERLARDPRAAAQIVTACAHLPLALGIIAARAAARPDLSLAQIARDLAARPDLDAFAADDDPAADVRTAFSWSYRQLDTDAARVFRLAGVHPGPWLERHAVAALAGLTAERAGYLLDVLARACMIAPARPGRFGLHDLLRGYAAELADAQEGPAGRRQALTRLFDYYLHTSAAAMDTAFPAERARRPVLPATAVPVPDFEGERQALAWLDEERADVVAVVAHAAGAGWPDHAIGLSATLFRYLETGAQVPDAITIHRHARRAAQQTGDQRAEATALNSLGVVALRQGRFPQAVTHFEEALVLYRAVGETTGAARALGNLGFTEFLLGREQAAEHIRQSMLIFRRSGDKPGEARAFASLGCVDLRQGRYQQAIENLHRSLALCRDTRDRGGQARALGYLAEIDLRQGRYPRAAGQLNQALGLFRELGDRVSEADTLGVLGLVSLRQGDHREAGDQLAQALELCEQTGDLSSRACVLNSLGEFLLVTDRATAARVQYAAALEAAGQAGESFEQARAHDGLARACQAVGALAQARDHWQRALSLYDGLGAPEAGQIRAQLAKAHSPPRPENSFPTEATAQTTAVTAQPMGPTC
ncbi:MAG TPA: tetratricopeptide repeat protein [Streptosporangiaceae bacterium]|jgi:tetratricopeptide (TPR) repeat protein/transcriptional regulator with XRE-family HTH domain